MVAICMSCVYMLLTTDIDLVPWCTYTHTLSHMAAHTQCMHTQSGKLVQKMFHKIQELIDDPDALVCVLIDEVHIHKVRNT